MRRLRRPTLRFSPYAFAKFLFFRDCGPTEIGAFGISDPSDLLFVRDIVLVPQRCTRFSVDFDDAGVADHFETQAALGRQPQEFSRIWLHTHPGPSPEPSSVDEATFERVFGTCHWSVMGIVALGGASYARFQFDVGLSASVDIPLKVDFGVPFEASDECGWEREYRENVITLGEAVRGRVADDGIPVFSEFELFQDQTVTPVHIPQKGSHDEFFRAL